MADRCQYICCYSSALPTGADRLDERVGGRTGS